MSRFRHEYCRPGAVEYVCRSLQEVLGDAALVLTRDEAVARGWFGAVTPEVRPRLGDVLVACRGDHAVLSSAAFPYEATLIGMQDRKSTRLNSSHANISYAAFCLKKK